MTLQTCTWIQLHHQVLDDATVIGLISNNEETAYGEEEQHLTTWCTDNNLLLNTSKTKEDTDLTGSFKFLGTHILEDLSWTTNTSSLIKKAHQLLVFMKTLRKNHLSSAVLRVVTAAHHITGTPLPAIEDVQKKRCLHRARSILKDSSHPSHRLFSLLPSGRCFRTLRTRTSRLRNSFFSRAVSLLNSS
ncbi:hypothetical protein D4764_0155140 [Takifugu flavidus]|uniref:Alkylated DNA repair protein AlkB homologue 8 N-terminal domain-containing protein n=1 Tax=Takifugu flavidus TaxID=433684 RepID=A0A5C6MCW1_9TELE|nr:hypothetical protein D4764_0155140 [Takifugu flavidus]